MVFIDSLKFSREHQTESGALPVVEFERLRDNLFAVPRAGDADDTVSYEVLGGTDARERSVLWLKVAGRLLLQCQRCLKVLDYDLAIDTTLRLVPEATLDAEMSDDPDEPDCIAASAELDLAALIEDEILLALPAYPRHEEGSCNNAENVQGQAGTSKVSAFSALSELNELGVLKHELKQKASKSKE